MTPKGSQHLRHRSKTVQQRQLLAPLRGAYAKKPLAGGVISARPPANGWQASGLPRLRLRVASALAVIWTGSLNLWRGKNFLILVLN